MFELFKKYKIEELYVGIIGIVKREDRDTFRCIGLEENKFIIYKKDYGDSCTRITTNVTYPYFHATISLDFHIGEFMVYKQIPLSNAFSHLRGKKSLSLQEISNLELEINAADYRNHHPEEEAKEEPKDKVMAEINKVAGLIKNIVDPESKQKLLLDIQALAKYYVEQKIAIQAFSSSLELKDPESSLINECLDKLCDVEFRINNELENNTIRKDLEILTRNLKVN